MPSESLTYNLTKIQILEAFQTKKTTKYSKKIYLKKKKKKSKKYQKNRQNDKIR